MNVSKKDRANHDEVSAAFERNAGNIRATAKELGIARSTVRRILAPTGKMEKPLAAGSIEGTTTVKALVPLKGKVLRYILTSAQNNTFVHESAWENLQALANHYDAAILVGTYTYNQNRYGKLSVKRGKDKTEEKELWYDPKIVPYIEDRRIELAKGLVWCGEMNILPTAVNPLAGLESYTGRASAIFPHAKLAMRSIATMQGEGVKLNYTTGTVTQRNYIQKREGVIAEFHHIYGALLVEVNSNGNWWVRQLNEDENGTMQDLHVLVQDGKIVSTSARVEAVTLGDLHSTQIDESVKQTTHSMLGCLMPKYLFLHDIMEGASVNHHDAQNPHAKFYNWMRGLTNVANEVEQTRRVLQDFSGPWTDSMVKDAKTVKSPWQTVVVSSNHDDPWLQRWLREYDYRKDPSNTELFLKAQSYMYSELAKGKMPRDINILEFLMRNAGYKAKTKFLLADESFLTCDRKIENGMHGHLGPAGRWGSPLNLSQMARKANTAHTHSAGIYNGLYVAGTSTKLRWNYNQGPSNWTHSHIVTYPSGKRTIVTIYDGKWRA